MPAPTIQTAAITTSPARDLSVRAILPWALLALLLSSGPYLLAWLATPKGQVFSGILANHNDFTAYIAAMRQGAAGQWLFHFNFSPNVWQPQLMLPAYILAGKVLGSFSNNNFLWFNVLRVAALIFTMGAFLVWVRRIFPGRVTTQRVAWLFLTLGGGLGWLLWPLTASWAVSTSYFPDLSRPEWTTLLIAINPPHYTLGLGLEVFYFATLPGLARPGQRRRATWQCTLLGLTLALVYVYHIALIGFVTGLYLLYLAWQARRIPWRVWLAGSIIILPLMPLLFYYGYWVNRDPAWASYVVSNLNAIPPPPLLGLLIGFGLLGLLAAAGIRHWWRLGQERLVLLWLAGNLLLLYLPIVQYAGRFALGIIVPVGTLAAFGLEEVALPWLERTRFYRGFARLTPTPYASLRRVSVILTVPSGLLVALLLSQSILTRPGFPTYLPQADVTAANWLAEQLTADDLVLAYYPIGNYLPAVTPGRVFVGQFFLTSDYEGKLALAEQFWQTDDAGWQARFLDEWAITYVFQGTFEQALGPDQAEPPPGRVVYQRDGIIIYQIGDPMGLPGS
ncbi:MAG: hypothetical protein H6666_01970 [Ardenticatenaceae bacterium]|nr:hypothetical protein [Ardenticatenaceae bacterium]